MSRRRVRIVVASNGRQALVDEEDYEKASKFSWKVNQGWNGLCANYKVSYRSGVKKKKISLHRLVASRIGLRFVVPINGDYFDCRRSNLASVSSCGSPGEATGARGVSLDGRRFRARITVAGQRVNLGTFATLNEATSAYERAKNEAVGTEAAALERSLFCQGKAQGSSPPRRDERDREEIRRPA